MSAYRREQIDPYLLLCTKLKSMWIKYLNINPVTLNLIEQRLGSSLEQIGTEDNFLNITSVALTLRSRINKLELPK